MYGEYVLQKGDENTIRMLDMTSGQLLRTFVGATDNIYCYRCSIRLDIVLAAGKDNMARIWRASTGEQMVVMSGHTDEIIDMAYTDTL